MMIELLMKNGSPYQIGLCIEAGTQHTREYLKEQITNGIDSMSNQSRWQRFFSSINRLSDKQLDFLTNLDGKDSVAWCASIQINDKERGIGLARYVKLTDENNVAEFAITVIDEFQGQGIGYELLKKLTEAARANHLEVLRGYILSSNKDMLSLCKRFNAAMHTVDSCTVIANIPIVEHTDSK